MTTKTKRDLSADLAICNDVVEYSPYHWFIMHDTDVMSEDPPGSCELDSIAWASAPVVAQFIAEARTGWPEAIRRAIAAEAEVERLGNEIDTLDQIYLAREEQAGSAYAELERLRAGIAAAMTYPPGIINAKLRKLLTEVQADE